MSINLLFFGGKRFLGNKIVSKLINSKKYNIDIVYRNKRPIIKNKNKVNFIKCERDKLQEIKKKLNKKKYEIIFDNNCYSFKNFKNILDGIKYKSFIYIFTSSVMTYIHDEKSKAIFNKNQINKLPDKTKEYIRQKSKIEKYLKKSKNKFIIFRIHNLIGKNDHSSKTDFLFSISEKDLKKFKIKKSDKIQFALVDDVVKIIYKNIQQTNYKKFNNKLVSIANEPAALRRIIFLNKNFKNRSQKIFKFNQFPIPLNFIIKKNERKSQFHSSLEQIIKKI
jgi:nucleoside-diphosphate-sugar epimerase